MYSQNDKTGVLEVLENLKFPSLNHGGETFTEFLKKNFLCILQVGGGICQFLEKSVKNI